MTSIRRLSLASDEAQVLMPQRQAGALRVAIATQDMKGLNAHFGAAKCFAVFDVTCDAWTFMEALAVDNVSDESGNHQTGGDARIAAKVEALKGCHLLFCLAIGGPSAARLVSVKIHPVKVPHPQFFEDVLSRTQTMLRTAPPPWLRKVLAEVGDPAQRLSFDV
ncbi:MULTISPECIES: nitrogen fixation protein NifX [Microvirga]|uniref:nitrogen fixation protein NifX n=1 Tax=Microvirga TaxID=186650 RepID=UPI001B36803C|nr:MULTISPECIES: nitrogen fixation protein NifX [unclassified Microvirga]MBQ0820666.1 nitrogen fixation protein NifX [Microvirga sp. HBU67558]